MKKDAQNLDRLLCQLAADAMWGGKREIPQVCKTAK